jgi:uncharacterized protein YkwD
MRSGELSRFFLIRRGRRQPAGDGPLTARPTGRTRLRIATGAVALLAVVLAGCNSLYSSTPAPAGSGTMRSQLVALHNGARAAAGIGPLTEVAGLDSDAQYAANRLMLSSGGGCNLVHTSPAQMSAWYGGTWAENIACAPNSPNWSCASMQPFNNLFISSPPHRANILNGGYTEVGVGVACGGSYTFVVVHFSG